MRFDAEPLTEAQAVKLRSEGGRTAFVDGKEYDLEELHRCDCCEALYPCGADLDGDLLCEECAAEAQEELDAYQSLRGWYHSRVL